MPTCRHCNRESDAAHYDRVVHNITPLHGPWSGWRMAGRDLVSPDGVRMTPERVRGYALRADLEARRDGARARNASRKAVRRELVKVVVVDLDDWRRRHFGSGAA